MRALVMGASAGVGRALAEALAARGDALLLVASDARDLEALAAHLRLVHGVRVATLAADASRPEICLDGIRGAAESFGDIDGLFFPIGVSRADDRGTLPIDEAHRLIDVNLTVIVGIIGWLLPKLIAAGGGNIIGFGSVAAIRGRGANMVYAAAKRGLESYFESVRHLVAATGVTIQFYRLGYVATQQSFGQRLLFPASSPQEVAERVMCNLGRDLGSSYVPRYWAVIARIVSALPWFVYRRLNF